MARGLAGHIERLPSGSWRAKIYAGTDPLTGREIATAAATLGRLLAEVDEERFPDRDATLGHALDKYLEVEDLEVSTREAHEGYIRRTIKPVLGQVKIRKLGADSLDSLYAALKRCSRLCGRLPKTEHHTDGAHQYDQGCGPAQGSPDEPTARVRPTMRAPRVQADETGYHPADSLDHLLSARPRGALRLGEPERGA